MNELENYWFTQLTQTFIEISRSESKKIIHNRSQRNDDICRKYINAEKFSYFRIVWFLISKN
jgi:hypothetical protein